MPLFWNKLIKTTLYKLIYHRNLFNLKQNSKFGGTLVYSRFILLFFFVFTSYGNLHAQNDDWWQDKKYKDEKVRIKYFLCKKSFEDILKGFNNRNINFINLYFDSQVYLNIISKDRGYYSSDQAELIILDFMDYFKPYAFSYSTSHRKSKYAFVLGSCNYNVGMGKRKLKLSVSLKYRDSKWLIDQININ